MWKVREVRGTLPPVTRWTLSLLLIALSGCSFIDDFGRYSVGDGGAPDTSMADSTVPDSSMPDSTMPDGSVDSTVMDTGTPDTGPPLPTCATAWLEPGVSETTTTTDSGDDSEGSCGGAGSNDVVYAFVAPEDDYYLFDTNGSGFDTVLYLDETCAGDVELACNDDGATPPQSEVVRKMNAGDTVIVTADGNAGDSGDLTLTADAVSCPDTNLVPAILPVETTTVGRPDDYSSSCGGTGAGDRAFRYTAGTDGFRRFRMMAETTGFRPLISMERGPICGGDNVQCEASNQDVAEITRYLYADEVVTIHVDGRASGHEGDYKLEVEEPTTLSCTTTDLGAGPVSGTLSVGDTHTHSGSCGEAYYVQSRSPRVTHPNPDIAVRVTGVMMPPPPPCSIACMVDVSAGFPFILSVQETTTCNGDEIACQSSMPNGTGFRGSVELVHLEPAGGEVIIILDRQIQDNDVSGIAVPYPDNYSISYGCAAIC